MLALPSAVKISSIRQFAAPVQAVEAKENLTIGRDSMTQASVTYQTFFRYYDKLAGMTVPLQVPWNTCCSAQN